MFCAMLLPDILAPLCILSVAVLFSFYDRLGGLDKVKHKFDIKVDAFSRSAAKVVEAAGGKVAK